MIHIYQLSEIKDDIQVICWDSLYLRNYNLLFIQTALSAENSSHIENISVTDDHGLDKGTTEEVELTFF